MPIGNGPDIEQFDREREKEQDLMDEVYRWWDSLNDEEQYNLMLDWYPNEFTEDENADAFFGDMPNETQLWIYQRENKCTEEDLQAKEDFVCDLEFERRRVDKNEL